MNSTNKRTAKYLDGEVWKDINPSDLKKDMVFMLYEPDGTPVMESPVTAITDTYLNENGIETIQYA